jgi:hypothetical protein
LFGFFDVVYSILLDFNSQHPDSNMTLDIQQVLISDPVDPICSQILQNHGISVTYARQWTKERLLQEIQVPIPSNMISIV